MSWPRGVSQSPYVLAQSGIPFILAGGTAGGGTNQFTMGNNGALTTLPVLPTTYSGGAWIYMPANGIFAGSTAGWYWFVASSTTAGTVYNNQYVSGDPKLAVPATPTPFVSTGPGLVSNTLALVTGPGLTLPGGTLGPNGLVEAWLDYSIANTANFKTMSCGFAGNFSATAGINNNTGGGFVSKLVNRNSLSLNVLGRTGGYSAWSVGGASVYTAINTAVDILIQPSLTLPLLASEFIVLENYKILVHAWA